MPRNYRDFSRPSYRDDRWLETQWVGFSTEAGTRIHLWAGFRTNLEVATTKVFAVSTVAEGLLDMDFCDQQYNIPMAGARLSDFSLWSGLSMNGRRAPQAWTVSYRSPCGRMTADLQITAMMAPVDLEFTKVQGAGEGFVGFHRAVVADLPQNRSGQEPVGHIDQTVRVVGEVVIDGEREAVDGVGQRDHSWSPRAEFHHVRGTFDMVHFGDELTLLAQVRHDADGRTVPTHAYVLRQGEPRRVTEISVGYENEGFRIPRFRYEVTDETGERYAIAGERRSGFEIDMGPNIYVAFEQFDCSWDGRTGLGEVQWHDEVMKLQGIRRRERRAARATA